MVVRLNDYTYRSTDAVMGGENLVGVGNKVRAESGLAAGDAVEVELTLDTEPRVMDPPDDLVAAMVAAPGARDAGDRLSSTGQREHAESVQEAKKPDPRARRIAMVVDHLLGH